jgi:hypothetical protein
MGIDIKLSPLSVLEVELWSKLRLLTVVQMMKMAAILETKMMNQYKRFDNTSHHQMVTHWPLSYHYQDPRMHYWNTTNPSHDTMMTYWPISNPSKDHMMTY